MAQNHISQKAQISLRKNINTLGLRDISSERMQQDICIATTFENTNAICNKITAKQKSMHLQNMRTALSFLASAI
jgi:hypothetical protein